MRLVKLGCRVYGGIHGLTLVFPYPLHAEGLQLRLRLVELSNRAGELILRLAFVERLYVFECHHVLV